MRDGLDSSFDQDTAQAAAEHSGIPYVLGHSPEELARLERQAEFFAETTREVLTRAGLRPGMRVLDLGCGVGDVSLAAARLVGPKGAVLGVDRAPDALATARRRAAAAGCHWARFLEADFSVWRPEQSFDALIGRFILLYLAQPSEVLTRLIESLAPQGCVAFIEMDVTSSVSVPPMPAFDRAIGWIAEVYRRAGIEPDMGSRLFATFRRAGLSPRMIGASRVEAGADPEVHDYLVRTLRSLAPMIERFGVATAEEIGIDGLGARLAAESADGDACIIFPRLVGACAPAPG